MLPLRLSAVLLGGLLAVGSTGTMPEQTLAQGKAVCSQFRTCEGAKKALSDGATGIDGDNDGIACERTLCGYGSGSSGGLGPGSTYGGGLIKPLPAPAYNHPKPTHPIQVPLASGPATLISVGDGDTIRVATPAGQKVTIRLACIDAPETAQGESGAQATAALRQLLAGGRVELRPQTVDPYGRTVAEVYASGRNVNLDLVKSGAAYAYRKYLSGCDEVAYLGAEREAEMGRRRVWSSGGNEQRLWDFRKNR